MRRMIVAMLLAVSCAAHGQDISSLKLCSFDYDVSNSSVGFPDRVTEIAPGVKRWTYSLGEVLVFRERLLVAITADDGQLRVTDECTPAQIEDAAKDLALAATGRQPVREAVRIGMTTKQVLASNWGRPQDIRRTTTKYGTQEQWVYSSRNYLYFENGILTSIQN